MADRVLAHAQSERRRRCYPREDRDPTDRCEAQNYGWHSRPWLGTVQEEGTRAHLHHTQCCDIIRGILEEYGGHPQYFNHYCSAVLKQNTNFLSRDPYFMKL